MTWLCWSATSTWCGSGQRVPGSTTITEDTLCSVITCATCWIGVSSGTLTAPREISLRTLIFISSLALPWLSSRADLRRD